MALLNDEELENSAVVANCEMNRERSLSGSNGYAKEVGLHPLEFLKVRVEAGRSAAWLDLCCGSGRALIEAAEAAQVDGWRADIAGIDLAGMFYRHERPGAAPTLIRESLRSWRPDRSYDLITCVHGLHYMGDKLRTIAHAASCLVDDGLFVANLALENLKLSVETTTSREAATALRRTGLEYDRRKRLVICRGRKEIDFPYLYLGAEDGAGANYTGQPAVNSHYRTLTDERPT